LQEIAEVQSTMHAWSAVTTVLMVIGLQLITSTSTKLNDQIVYTLETPSRLHLDEFHTGVLRHSLADDLNYDSFVYRLIGSMEGGITLDVARPGLSNDMWEAYLNGSSRSWSMQRNDWSEAMLFVGAYDNDNVPNTVTLVTSRRLTESQILNSLDAWLNKTIRSSIEYLKLSCLQLSHDYDYDMCSCTTLKRKTSGVAGGGCTGASNKSTFTAAAYRVVDLDQLCDDQTRGNITADDFDGFNGVRVLEFSTTSVPDLDAESLSGLTSVELVQFSHVFLSSSTLSSKVLCSLRRALKAVRMFDVRHDSSDRNAVLQLIACHGRRTVQDDDVEINQRQNNVFGELLNVETIQVSKCNVSWLTNETFSGSVRESLRFLDFSYNVIDLIETNAFLGMTNLVLLDLSNNRLYALSDGVTADLKSLLYLDMQDNRLERISTKQFDNNEQLMFLYLNRNRLSRIEGTFSMLQNLHLLFLHENILESLTENMFSDCISLWLLSIRHNSIRYIHKSAFRNISINFFLDASFNLLDNVTDLQLSLSELSNLRILNLENNKLKSVNADMFQYPGSHELQLHVLNLASNDISFVHPETFGVSTSLKMIDLGNNSLSELREGVFDGLPFLLLLKLGHNRLRSLPARIFQNNSNLQMLEINDNMIKLVGHQLAMPGSLMWLDMRNNRMTNVPIFSSQLPNVIFLSMSGNYLPEVTNESFVQFPKLIVLNLGNCSTTYVQNDAFYWHQLLTHVDLGHNPLQNNLIEKPFNNFYLLGRLPLLFLNLKNTGISAASNLFDGDLSHVFELQLSDNPITYLPDQTPPSFYNEITVYSLTVLNMSNCSLTWFSPNSLKYAIQLRTVDFRRNQLVEFQPLNVSLWETQSTYNVLLDDNPVECTCRMKWLKYNDHYKLNYCQHPVHGTVTKLSTFPDEDFLCKREDCWVDEDVYCACFTDDERYIDKPVLLICSNRSIARFPDILRRSISVARFDGNRMTSFTGNKQSSSALRELYLDRNEISRIESGAFDSFPNLVVLSLTHNRLSFIDGNSFSKLYFLQVLRLDDNSIVTVESGSLSNLHSLRTLSMRSNSLTYLDDATTSEIAAMPQLKELTLDDNPWNCSSCDNATFKHWLADHTNVVVDVSRVTCGNGTAVLSLSDDAFICYDTRQRVYVTDVLVVPLSVSIMFSIMAATLIFGLVFFIRHRLVVKAWLYSRYRWTLWPAAENEDCNFDAVVVHDDDDPGADEASDSIEQQLVEFEPRFRVLCHQRRCLPNENRLNAIARHIDDSRRTIIVINGDEFTNNEFIKHAFQCAYERMTLGNTHHRVIIVTTDVVDVETLRRNKEMDDSLRAFLKAKKPLVFGEGWFWQKLFYLMPRSKNSERDIGVTNTDSADDVQLIDC
jgi:Leucine-rich repeat (LRR) protein